MTQALDLVDVPNRSMLKTSPPLPSFKLAFGYHARVKRKDDDNKLPTDGAPKLAHNPFGALGALRGSLPVGAPAATEPPGPRAPPEKKGPARAVVRYERKGRGGKEVTLVEQLELPLRDLEAWLKALKGALGCGGVIEGSALVLQGDHRERLKALLEARGVRRVSVG